MEGEDFCGEGAEVGGEEREGDVFGGFLVVVAELDEIIYVSHWVLATCISTLRGLTTKGWLVRLTWIVTNTSCVLVCVLTCSRTAAQSPPSRKDTVVAPLWPRFIPLAGERRVVFRKPSPQPPSGAVVESPARTK